MFCKIKQQDLPYPISIILNFNLPILLCRGIRFITLSKRLFLTSPLTTILLPYAGPC